MFRCTFKKVTIFVIVQLLVVIYWNFSVHHTKCVCEKSENLSSKEDRVDRETLIVPSSKTTEARTDPIRHEISMEKDAHEFNYFLVVIVLTSLGNKQRRDIIRQTWYPSDEMKKEVLLKFALGTMGMAEDDYSRIQKENEEHNDLLLLIDLVDSFANLTRKVLSSFVWTTKNVQFSYFLKCDDDTFVVLKTLVSDLKQRTSTRLYYWGFFDGRASVKRAGKYQESNWFLCDKYIPYALGGGYVLSGELVKMMALNSAHLKLYVNEDVSVGSWLAPYDIERNHDVRFDTEYQSRGCNNAYIVTHKQPTHFMLEKHNSLKETGKLCKKEFRYKASYIYDWSKPPSECCKRQIGIP